MAAHPTAVVVGLCAHGLAVARSLGRNGVQVHALEANDTLPGTATRHAFRRRGLQRAIIARAMNDGRDKADLIIATTAPGSVSQRTFERCGFRVVYTRAILVKY